MAKYKISNLFKGDRTLWMIYLLLVCISLVEVFSAASSLSFKTGDYLEPLRAQGTYILLGLMIIVVLSHIPCRRFRGVSFLGVMFGMGFLLAAIIFGQEVNGSSRWFSIMGFQVQPSEFVKPLLINGVASLLAVFGTKKNDSARIVVFFVAFIESFLVILLIFSENFSTAVLIATTVIVLFLISEVPWQWLFKTLGIVFLVAVLVFGLAKTEILHIDRLDTWLARIEHFNSKGLSPIEADRPDLVDLDRDGQETHAKIAIATSGIIGKGPGNSVQRDYLSQAYSDFIYAIIIEEFGLLGGAVVIGLYFWMFYACVRISRRCVNPFPAYLIIGLGTIIVLQAMINISVATGFIPITGQNLPLISRGGSSMLATSMMFGMMMSVSRFAHRERPTKNLSKLSEEELEELAIEEDFRTM